MAISLNDLVIYNAVESTDPIVGAFTLPFFEKPVYQPGITFSNNYEGFVKGDGAGRGSQVLKRKLGKVAATIESVDQAGALRYTHVNTGDTLQVIPLTDVIKHSEELYEAVESARASATGAAKAEIVVKTIVEGVQSRISKYLQDSAIQYANNVVLTKANLKDEIILARAELDYKPNVLMVSPAVETLLLQLATDDGWLAYYGRDTITTGAIGRLLGMEVFVDPNLKDSGTEFILYDKDRFDVYTTFQNFSVVPAADFDGSYIRAMAIQGNETLLATFAPTIKGAGSWCIAYPTKA